MNRSETKNMLFAQISAGAIPLSFLLIAIIGVLDYSIGPEISTALFYVLPIGAAAWYGKRPHGYIMSLLAALTWLVTDHYSGHIYSTKAILFWNGFVRLALFLIIAHLMASYRAQLNKVAERAETDALTGVANSRGFYERADEERLRAERSRRPFSLAYIDLDNFKTVNDKMGHQAGDALLKQVAAVMRAQTRRIDLVARLGGDEFALLFVEAGFAEAERAITKIRGSLLEAMQARNWPVTFSIGMVTFSRSPASVMEMVKEADNLMYKVKKTAKNDICHLEWGSPAAG